VLFVSVDSSQPDDSIAGSKKKPTRGRYSDTLGAPRCKKHLAQQSQQCQMGVSLFSFFTAPPLHNNIKDLIVPAAAV
jgi:hypothetical protein